MIAGATPGNVYLQSACSSKFVRIAKNGTVSADDNGQSGPPRKYCNHSTKFGENKFFDTAYKMITDARSVHQSKA